MNKMTVQTVMIIGAS